MKRSVLLCVAVLASACSGVKKDWDEEIILQLFKPANEDVGTIEVEVEELIGGGRKRKQAVDVRFTDCSANRVRIIPRQVDGSYPALRIIVRYDGPTGREAREHEPVSVPAGDEPLSMVLRPWPGLRQQDLEPSACAPSEGLLPSPDGGSPQLRLGDPCTKVLNCLGSGTCLTELTYYGDSLAFPKGYCSVSCSAAGETCAEGAGVCVEFQQNNTAALYCLKKCASEADCRTPDYRCAMSEAPYRCVPAATGS